MKSDNEEKLKEEILAFINNKSEFDLTIMLKNILVYMLEDKDFSKSILHKFESSIFNMKYLLAESLEGKVKVPKLWRLKYYLRNLLHSKDLETRLLSNFIIQMFEIIVMNNLFISDSNLQIKNIDFMSAAVKWADYLTRSIKK